MINLKKLFLILFLCVTTDLVPMAEQIPSPPNSHPNARKICRVRGFSFLLAALRPSRPTTPVGLLHGGLPSRQSRPVLKRSNELPPLFPVAPPHRVIYGIDLDVNSVDVFESDGAWHRYPNKAYAADERIADLYAAVIHGTVEQVKTLLEVGVNYLVCGDARTTLLMHACANLRADIVEYLLTLPGIEVNAQDVMGYTALYFVVDSATKECNFGVEGFEDRVIRIIRALATAGINFEFKPNRDLGRTVFELAIARYYKNSDAFFILKTLLKAGARCEVSVVYQNCLAKIRKYLIA